MVSDLIDLIDELMQRKQSDLPARLASQNEALDELPCTDLRLGKWFEEDTVPYVLAAFNLSDKDFASVFPRLKHISASQRQSIIKAFEEHIERCPRCYRRRSYDLEFEARIESALHENRDVLLAKLECATADEPSEDEHVIAAKARGAHHS